MTDCCCLILRRSNSSCLSSRPWKHEQLKHFNRSSNRSQVTFFFLTFFFSQQLSQKDEFSLCFWVTELENLKKALSKHQKRSRKDQENPRKDQESLGKPEKTLENPRKPWKQAEELNPFKLNPVNSQLQPLQCSQVRSRGSLVTWVFTDVFPGCFFFVLVRFFFRFLKVCLGVFLDLVLLFW